MDTRPTTDKVKESLFNIIQFEIEGRSVLDLFGGTGQLGDRGSVPGGGAMHLCGRPAGGYCPHPGEPEGHRTGEGGRVVQGDAISFLSGCRERFGVIFLDPPYQTPAAGADSGAGVED